MSDFDPATEYFHEAKNRHGLKLFIKVVEPTDRPVRGNAYLVHGFRDVHDTPHMRALTQASVRSGYRVIIWDATHSWGRSGGDQERATFYFHHGDLEDVILWSRSQPWFREPYVLAGHSLGGMAAGTYAAAHPRQVDKLILLAPVVSGRALRRRIPGVLRFWWRWRGSIQLPQRGTARYSWEFMRSSWAYDLLNDAGRLAMPVLIVAAERDWIVPVSQMRKLQRSLGEGKSRLQIVTGAKHAFDLPWEYAEVVRIVRGWLG